jgi:hypothetical protein
MRRPPEEFPEPVYIEDLAETILSDMQGDKKKGKKRSISKVSRKTGS